MSRILVVEDEKHLAEGLRFNLEADGYEVEVVDTGEAALDLLLRGQARFDVVILDVMLPGMSGFVVVSELAQGRAVRPDADPDRARPSRRRLTGLRGRRGRLSHQAVRACRF